MVENEFLQVFDLTLKLETPLFVGSGKKVPKKCFLYDKANRKVHILDENKFAHWLIQKRMVDRYEAFMMDTSDKSSLDDFLKRCGLYYSVSDLQKYALNATEVQRPIDIHCFMRDAYGRAYVPGSSVKGALRTVYLQSLIAKDGQAFHESPLSSDKPDSFPESDYLNMLNCNSENKADAINSILRGVHISDSLPIPDSLLSLTEKYDVRVDGSFNMINVCREVVQPKAEIHFKLTLDQSILKDRITKDTLVQAIKDFDSYYWDTYMGMFDSPSDEGNIVFENDIILGGGSGFFSKSLIYPYLGEKRALNETARYMESAFEKHYHDKDAKNGISPHMMNYTKYKGQLYPMGFCTVTIS